jgi:two-component system nitrogen regulation response regulator NtrX
MSQERILIIDDETSIRSSLRGILEDEGFQVKTAESGEEALRFMDKQSFDLLLLDIWLPEMSGLDVLRKVKTMDETPPVVMISGHGTVETAVKAVKMGAFDFLEKPLTLEKVVLTVRNALKQSRLEEENTLLRDRFRERYHLAGQSLAMHKLRDDIAKAAPTNSRILIHGENGTGRELLARLIHQESRRRDKRFLELNCAAVPADMLENELFGYVRGSQPHAVKDKKGKFLLADGGTLFLDEVGDMRPTTQAKLVRVIEEQRFEPLGSTDSIAIDTRLVAATSKNLKELIGQKAFREDLFFKLNVIPLTIPPLRERPDDIPLLINHFLEHFAAEYGKKPKSISPEAVQAFRNYYWPGNVGELMNVIERFIIMVDGPEITEANLSLLVEAREMEQIPGLGPAHSLEAALRLSEKKLIHEALLRNRWDMDKTASDLKIGRPELQQKITALQITLIP